MRGILSIGTYLPHYRLDLAQVSAFLGSGGRKGFRTVASYDEDTTTMGFEAARRCLRGSTVSPEQLIFSTVTPAYVDRTNATAIFAALGLPRSVVAYDTNGSVRSLSGAFGSALHGTRTALVIGADIRSGSPTGVDESAGGDGASAALIGSDSDGPLLAEHVATASCTDEFVDRWRTPGDTRSKLWEERFGEVKYLENATSAWTDLLRIANVSADQITVAVSGLHSRAVRAVGGRLKAAHTIDDHSTKIGTGGAAQPLLLLNDLIHNAQTNELIALMVLSDGAEVHLFRRTSLQVSPQIPTVAAQVATGSPVSYGKFLSWRGVLPVEPPRRPEPARASSSASDRNEAWKFGFVAGRDSNDGTITMPPAQMGASGEPLETRPMAEVLGTVATYTIDRLAYSPSPPIVFAVVDFDGGGRLPIELADTSPDEVRVGDRVEMTFRKLGTADGIHNYFWKARPIRNAEGNA
jgi:hydroxymethylglutaryl-CoA synthase